MSSNRINESIYHRVRKKKILFRTSTSELNNIYSIQKFSSQLPNKSPMIAHEYIHPKETYANIFSYPTPYIHMTMVREARRIMRFGVNVSDHRIFREEKLTEVRTVENCPDQSSIKTSLLLSMTSPRSVMQCVTFSPPWRAIKIFLQREKLCSLHRETFTSPIVIQTEMRIFYGTCCYEWRINGVLLFLFRFPFFFFFFSFNRSGATSLRGDRKKIGVNISV